MSQKDDRDLDAPTPPGGPLRRDAVGTPTEPAGQDRDQADDATEDHDDE